MSEVTGKNSLSTDEINLREVFLTFWRGKWLITAVSVALAGIAALIVPKSYIASSVVVRYKATELGEQHSTLQFIGA